MSRLPAISGKRAVEALKKQAGRKLGEKEATLL